MGGEGNNNYKDILLQAHPIFRVPTTKIYWCENVKKISSRRSLSRILVIASPGIFLLKKKSFPRSSVVARIISYSELALILVENNTLQICKPKVTMTIQHPKYLEAVGIICTVIREMFSELKPPKIVIDKSLQAQIDQINFHVNQKTLLADRFLSFCLLLPPKSLVIDQVTDIYHRLKRSPKCVRFNSELVSSNLVSAVAQSVSYDTKVQALQIQNVNLPIFLPHYNQIVQNNHSVKRVSFQSVSFTGSYDSYIQVLESQPLFKASSYSFLECQLKTNNFITFLKTFDKSYPVSIRSFSIVRANLNIEILYDIFNLISTSKTFDGLRRFCISEIQSKDPLESTFADFFNDTFLTNHEQLQTVTLHDDNFSVDKILPIITSKANKITTLNITRNRFNSNIEPIPSYQLIQELNLSHSTFSSETLLNFLKSFSLSEITPQTLILDSLNVNSQQELDIIYQNLKTIKLPKVQFLSWNSNLMNFERFQMFIEFVKLQNELTGIGISNCITPHNEINLYVTEIIKLIQQKQLKRLDIRGSSTLILSSNMIPILEALNEQKIIEVLDVTGQEIGQNGLNILLKLSNNCLEELRFDNNTPENFDLYYNFLNDIMNSKLLNSEWPENDIKSILQKVATSQRKIIENKFEQLKKKFVKKFNDENLNKVKQSQNQISGRTSKSRSATVMLMKKKNDDDNNNISKHLIDFDTLLERNQSVENYLKECIGELDNDKEPLLVAMKMLNDETSLEMFLGQSNV